jgi:hypothetical protein
MSGIPKFLKSALGLKSMEIVFPHIILIIKKVKNEVIMA